MKTGAAADSFDQPTAGSDGNKARSGTQTFAEQQLAGDWITVWRSELNAMAADPEIQEPWQVAMARWAGTLSSILRAVPQSFHDGSPEQARPPHATGAAASASAPDPGAAEIERLSSQVAALERRLAELERGSDSAGGRKDCQTGKPRHQLG